MKLPNSHCATVAREKIVDYLLNARHIRGKSKATFFGMFGFSVASWTALQEALITQGRSNPLVEAMHTEYGPRYTVKCNCPSPDGRNPCILTVWQIDAGSACPRLLTAFPAAR
ncbi:MAG: hypothetical protein M0Z99_15885 [Betaproteobacteria bacterium]|nr:hypothetical protein [Betaproteobacteria bacterium]